jgi:hypothetical protein
MKHLKTSNRVRPVEEIKHPAAQSISDTELVMREFDLSPEQIAIKQVDLLRGFHANWTERFAKNIGEVKKIGYGKVGSMPVLRFLLHLYPNEREHVICIPLASGLEIAARIKEMTEKGCKEHGIRPFKFLEDGDKALELPE